MPLVAHNGLPTYARLRGEGYRVLDPERARSQDIRALHVGLLNMMPDAALEATERQFFRLLGSSNPITQFHVHPFTLSELPRSDAASTHIRDHYETFEGIRERGLDALIVTGANVTEANLAAEIFWEPLKTVINWADEHVTSTLCSCLATHAVMLARYGVQRRSLAQKCWGVFEHDIVRQDHPLVGDVNTRMSVPHSRFNEITREDFARAGLHVLAAGAEPGAQLIVSADGFRTVFMQGHPEYDRISLMKEYKREVNRYVEGKLGAYPPMPKHYFDKVAEAVLDEYRLRIEASLQAGAAVPPFPELQVRPRLHNTWHDSGEALIGNWIGLVYQITHAERARPYMDGVDRDDPLGWLAGDESRLT